MRYPNATARSVIPGILVNVVSGRFAVPDRLTPVQPKDADAAVLVAVDPGDLANRWPVRVQRWQPDTFIVSDGLYSTIIHTRDSGAEIVLSAPGRCRAGALPKGRTLTGTDVTDRMDITERRVAASIAAFANWLIKGGLTDGR